jgi:hypothetical protein
LGESFHAGLAAPEFRVGEIVQQAANLAECEALQWAFARS